jgi:serine phosphatase RsbU (regulator of sigma subunit)
MAGAYAQIEIAFSQRARQVVPINELPFLIGRGSENGNHLALEDLRVSRKCMMISAVPEGFRIDDRGQAGGLFVNQNQVTDGRILLDGDQIRVGGDPECQLVFRSQPEPPRREEAGGASNVNGQPAALPANSRSELNRLSMLLEATSLLHSQLPLESIFATMLDHAIAITRADRGMLLEPDAAGMLQVKVARNRDRASLATANMNPSRTVLGQAIEQRAAVINEDLLLADTNVQTAHSVILQFLRSAVVIPLYNVTRVGTATTGEFPHDELLGAVYLDSKRASAFSALDRQILDALGAQAASILDNARLMLNERERQRLEQELSIAREIQQALLPQGLKDYPHLAITGIHRPCHEVGGDYFDVFPLPDGRLAILIADVAGKGLGAALLTTMLQGALTALTVGTEPVKVFEHLNRFLCDRSVMGRYATLFFGLLAPDGTLEYVRAGHPAPLLLRRGEVSELYQDGSFPIGLIDEASYTCTSIQLEPDDTLLLFTDGVTEAEDKDRNLFEVDRLIDAFGKYSCCSLDALQSGILGVVEKFSEGAKQSDDITLLLVRYRRPSGNIPAFTENSAGSPQPL